MSDFVCGLCGGPPDHDSFGEKTFAEWARQTDGQLKTVTVMATTNGIPVYPDDLLSVCDKCAAGLGPSSQTIVLMGKPVSSGYIVVEDE